jgi:hypothetical protein
MSAREAALEAREGALTAREKKCIEIQEDCRQRCANVLAKADLAVEEARKQVLLCTSAFLCIS